jgi:MFS transporter, AAHS family, 4-hydroxybenzoate transporter
MDGRRRVTDRAIVDVSQIIEGQRLNRFLVQLVIVSWLVTFFDGFDLIVISFAAPVLGTELHIDKVMMGNVFSIGLVGTLIGGFVFGYLGDRIGRRPTIILAVTCFGALTSCIALAATYQQLLWVRLLDGIAIGGLPPVCWALNIESVPKRYRATIVTVIMIGFSAGITVGGPVANWLMPKYGWQSLFVFGGGLSLAATLVLIALLPESVRYLVGKGHKADVVARILRRMAPTRPVPAAAQFVLGDEADAVKELDLPRTLRRWPRWMRPLARVARIASLLMKGELKWITPLLWMGYIFSSMAVYFFAYWSPSVFEALGFERAVAANAASVNSAAGALGGLLLMRFTDRLGAIAIAIMPLIAAPLLLLAGFVDLGYWGFLAANALIAVFLIGGHFGLHSIAGIFYPSAYRSNGAGWAISVAKIGSIAGPLIAGRLLETSLPVRHIFAVVASCPAALFVCMLIIGTLHSRLLRRERAQLPQAAVMASSPAYRARRTSALRS